MRRVLVVFGASTLPAGGLSANLRARLRTATAEAHRHPRAPIIVSGGAVTGSVEAVAMRKWLVGHGIEPRRIIVEPLAMYTLDNARRVAPLIAGLKASEVTLVTSSFHVPRSKDLLERELRAVSPRRVQIRVRAAADTLKGAAAEALRQGEVEKLARDSETQKRLLKQRRLDWRRSTLIPRFEMVNVWSREKVR